MIDLHTTATANGYKASIMLEETGLPYRVIDYDLIKGENFKPEYVAITPVARMPAIVDHDLPGGTAVSVYGTAAILFYLAEKTGRFWPADPRVRAKVYEWVGVIASDVGPAYSGQFAFNVIAPEKLPWAIQFYDKLCARMVQTLEVQLGQTPYLAGNDYTIADIIAYPVAAVSMQRYPGNLDGHPNLARWAGEIGARPAVQRGMKVPR
ncbi:MAG: glutathione binding-like protein [Steroidobacteraceae bacterium]|nr:glutathione S-transferase C-terminal domain-containing protein [Nevskiaceae bacterium]MCP5467125.1 glutathione S-transferase C-terminal domain-containing protein [Nevskiaceae bacterium]MCP5472046.1 glutathione S-transferase C-terminal domain-containing protein [Nevskiaceae bacterium]